MTDSQTWKKLESQRCQNTGCGGWLGWARQTLEYQVTDKTNQCLPKHSNISDSILLNVKASSHSMLFLVFIKNFSSRSIDIFSFKSMKHSANNHI